VPGIRARSMLDPPGRCGTVRGDHLAKLPDWLAAHQVRAYLTLAYLFTWPLFIIVLFVVPHSMVLQGTLGTLAVFGPALASLVVARASEPARIRTGRRAGRVTFSYTWALASATLLLFAVKLRGAPSCIPCYSSARCYPWPRRCSSPELSPTPAASGVTSNPW